MQRASKLTIYLAFFASFFSFCTPDSKPKNQVSTKPKIDTIREEPIPTEGAVTFEVTEGTVYWMGRKALGDTHNGAIQITGGEMLVNRGHLLRGNAVIDMTTISVSDIDDGGEKHDLESHLKDNDFFEVKKFPKATFTFDEVLPSNLPAFNSVISGELTMKGKTNPVNVPVKLTIENNTLVAESAAFAINRTQWGVNFRSGLLGTAKDKLIDDVVTVSLKLKAKAK